MITVRLKLDILEESLSGGNEEFIMFFLENYIANYKNEIKIILFGNIDLTNKINNLIYESIKFANKNPDISLPFIKKHSASLSNKVIKKHINLYVNDFSLNLGKEGQKAINMLCEKAKSLNLHIDSKIPNFLTL